MVPGSTFRYGSHFCRVTLKPRLSRRQPIEEAATPFPSEETTPPVTKIYFGAIRAACVLTSGLSALHRIDVHTIMFGTWPPVKSNSLRRENVIFLTVGAKPFRRERVCNERGMSLWSESWRVLRRRKSYTATRNRR